MALASDWRCMAPQRSARRRSWSEGAAGGGRTGPASSRRFLRSSRSSRRSCAVTTGLPSATGVASNVHSVPIHSSTHLKERQESHLLGDELASEEGLGVGLGLGRGDSE